MERYPNLPYYNRDEEESSEPSEPVYDEDSESEDGVEEDDEMCYVSRIHNNRKCVMYGDALYDVFASLQSSVKRMMSVLCPAVPALTNMVRFANLLVSPTGVGGLMDTGLVCVHPGCVMSLDRLAEHIHGLTQFTPVFTNEQLTAGLSALYLIFEYAADVYPEEFQMRMVGNAGQVRPHVVCRNLMRQAAGHLPANPTPTFMVDMLDHPHCRLERYGTPDVWVREELEMEAVHDV